MKDITNIHISGTISNTIYLFARNYGANITKLRGKIYSAEITDSSELIRDFVPVVRKIDNTAGMYDKVSKRFYTNAGSGEFITGPEI